MKEMFLLGAGASVEAKVPDSFEMTRVMVDRFDADHYAKKHSQILRFVIGGLLFQKGGKGENPFEGINIEDLFNAVQLLARRGESELGPFINSWHPLLDEFESGEISDYELQELMEILYKPLANIFDNSFDNEELTTRNFGNKLSQGLFFLRNDYYLQKQLGKQLGKVVKQIISSRGGEVFHQTTVHMIQKLIEMVWIEDSSRAQYITPLLKYSTHNDAVIATLNYDNLVELAGQSNSIPVDTGFESWSKTEEFSFNSSSVPLIKLHGSIDWALSGGEISDDKPSPYQVIRKINREKKKVETYVPAIVFGGKNKLTAKGPFLSLLRAFEQKLASSNRLSVIGYSFRDEHINEYIGKWLNRDNQNVLIIINPDESISNNSFLSETGKRGAKRIEFMIENASKGIESISHASET